MLRDARNGGGAISEVLLVEDDEELAELIASILSDYGYAVEWVTTASAALAWLAERQPSLILLDLLLPQASGVIVLDLCKRATATMEIPIVVISAAPLKLLDG